VQAARDNTIVSIVNIAISFFMSVFSFVYKV